MRIIDAYWEKRNLGVSTIEVEFSSEDNQANPKHLVDQMWKIAEVKGYKYIVCKLKKSNGKLLSELQNNGFSFVESQLQLSIKVSESKAQINKMKKFVQDGDCIKVISKEDIIFIQNKIMEGMFDSDRIALDPKFGKEMANQRYANWIMDEFLDGEDVYFVRRKGENVAFNLTKQINKKQRNGVLGGVFLEYQNEGLAVYFDYFGILRNEEDNVKIIKTTVSSNNVEALKLHQLFGFTVQGVDNILIKHI